MAMLQKRFLDIITNTKNIDEERNQLSPRNESITVIGMGYMGLPISSLIAQAGYSVTGVDLSQDKVDAINRAECPFDEVGMPELLKESCISQGFLKASTANTKL